ncbi:MAG: hypothetical protein IJH78_03815 [Clostridia bacterium]|nr:hypothetical protein [Clostridia bacterium]
MNRRIFVLIVGLLLIVQAIPMGHAEYVGSAPSSAVFLSQTRKHTCTLIAAAMMLRNYAELHQMDPESFSESAVRGASWRDGLIHDFDIDSINVQCTSTIREAEDRKEYLILFLRFHPEGVVIYDADLPHAILLFGYDSETDTFFCADTTTRRAGRPIPLTESLLKGKDQDSVIRSIDRLWYITGVRTG